MRNGLALVTLFAAAPTVLATEIGIAPAPDALKNALKDALRDSATPVSMPVPQVFVDRNSQASGALPIAIDNDFAARGQVGSGFVEPRQQGAGTSPADFVGCG